MQYARAKRRQNGGEKKGINRVFFLANRAESKGEKRTGDNRCKRAKKPQKGRFFAQINRQTPFGILHSFETGFLFKMPFCGTDAEFNRYGDRTSARACARMLLIGDLR